MSGLKPFASRLLRLVKPKSTWKTAVVVNDDSRVAFLLAAQVQHVYLVCNNQGLASAAEDTANQSDTNNLTFDSYNGDGLPFRDREFDLLLYHHCSHTFFDLGQWIEQASRILKPQGLLVLTTNLVPGTRLGGKNARRLREAGSYINAWHRLRDMQFREFNSQNQLEDIILGNGFEIECQEITDEVFDFNSWIEAANVNHADRIRLKVMLIQAPDKAREFLTPQFSGDRIRFRLPEITILAKLKTNSGRRGNNI